MFLNHHNCARYIADANHAPLWKKTRVSAFTQISSKGLICVIVVHDFEAPRKKTHTRKSYQQNRRWNFFTSFADAIRCCPQARRACERKAGGQARSYPSRSPEIEGPGTHTHLGNVLLHTHHLFSHPFARDYGTTPHWRTFNRYYCEFTFPIFTCCWFELVVSVFFPRNFVVFSNKKWGKF
jgi:hypothetical protein